MTTQHTSGPWEWISPNSLWGGNRLNEEILNATDDGKPYGSHSAMIEHHWDGEQAKANARLIAAAPDLLEALKNARRFVVSSHEPVCTELDDIDAAIAKATGEQT